MRAGAQRWPITIERPVPTQNATTGEVTYTWTQFAPGAGMTLFANISPIARAGSKSAWEALIAEQIKARLVSQFDIRFIPGIDATMRVVDWYGLKWDIKTIVNVGQRNRELWLICEFGLTQG